MSRRDTLALAASAFQKPAMDWGLRPKGPMVVPLVSNDLNRTNDLCRLLGAASLYAHHTGDDAAAVHHVREMLFLARAIDRQPAFISHLISNGVVAVAAGAPQKITPDLRIARVAGNDAGAASPDDVRALIAELSDSSWPMQGLKKAMQAERVMQYVTFCCMIDGQWDLPSGNATRSESPTLSQRIAGWRLKPILLNDAALAWDFTTKALPAADAPDWPGFKALVPAPPEAIGRSLNIHPTSVDVLENVTRPAMHTYRSMAVGRLAAVALAARWYAINHEGRLPARLDDLVPDYLPAVPLDPMAAGSRPLQYDRERVLIYSVGENGRDDGGVEDLSKGHDWNVENADIVVHLSPVAVEK